jgi:hypothetical protein
LAKLIAASRAHDNLHMLTYLYVESSAVDHAG